MNVMCVKNGLAPLLTLKRIRGYIPVTNRLFARYVRRRSLNWCI